MRRFLVASCVAAGLAGNALAGELRTFEAARKLEAEGKGREAFLAYLSVPGGEYAAVRLARPKAKEFLPAVEAAIEDPTSPARSRRALVVKGDLLLAAGDRVGALKCYRDFLAGIAAEPGKGWDEGAVPWAYYPVEPADPEHVSWEARPFTLGPGSHRDNWLIRRFIALEAWEHAAREFQRIWAVHRLMAAPYVLTFPALWEGAAPSPPRGDPSGTGRSRGGASTLTPALSMEGRGGTVGQQKRLVRPKGFSGRALQFAIDYAYFLKRLGRLEEAFAVLREALSAIDMDRNPNELAAPEVIAEAEAAKYPDLTGVADSRLPAWLGYSSGIARKEFIRLAYGAFKSAGKEDDLVRALEGQVAAGENRARRILARVRLHQNRPDDALALELAYVENGKFDDLSAAYRRGLACEESQKLAEAAGEYEKALALPFVTPNLPDADEEVVERRSMSARAVMPGEFGPPGRERFQTDVLRRLERIYGALAKTDQVLDVTLRQFEVQPGRLGDLAEVEKSAARFRVAGAEARFTAWAKAFAEKTDRPLTRACLAWVLGDHARAAEALAAAARPTPPAIHGPGVQDAWREQFRKAGQLRLLLEALVKANPQDGQARLELADLNGRIDGPEAIAALELLLDRGANYSGWPRDESDGRTRFRSAYHLAYRLMRLYEKSNQLDELRALGLRMTRAFVVEWKQHRSQYDYRDGNALPEDANAVLGLTIHHAEPAALDEVEKALADWPGGAAKAQIARRRAGGFKEPIRGAIGWANMPDGARACVSHENVLSLAVNEKHIYAGMPWGVAVYTLAGEPVTRVALAADARDLLVVGDHLWAATSAGLCRIATADWAVARLTLVGERPDEWHVPYTLAFDGKSLWIGTSRGVARLDPAENVLRIYSSRELLVSGNQGWTRLILDGGYVWADGGAGTRRYDRKGDTWAAVDSSDYRYPIRLVALADGVLWGHVWLNDDLRDRPCRIDRDTLAVSPVLIDESARLTDRQINGPFAYFGTWQGRPVLGPKRPQFYYDAAIDKLRLLPEDVARPSSGAPPDAGAGVDRPQPLVSDILPRLRGGLPWRQPNGVITCYNDVTHKHEVLPGVPFHTGQWSMARLADGTLVLAGRRERCPRYPNDQEGLFDTYETWTEEGGLYLISPDKSARRISSVVAPDTLPGDEVLGMVVNAAGYNWVCTNRGLAVLDKAASVVAHVTRADGLCANRVVGGAELGGRVYFATGWGDHGGGLAVYDPATAVFTGLFRSDGLATDKLAGVAADKGELVLTYDTEYMRFGGFGYRLHGPGRFDPKAGVMTAVGEVQMMRREMARGVPGTRGLPSGAPTAGPAAGGELPPMPLLGGVRVSTAIHRIHGLFWVAGSRGLAALPPIAVPMWPVDYMEGYVRGWRPTMAALEPRIVCDPALALMAAAERVRPETSTPAAFEPYLADKNPYLRRRALYFLAISNERSNAGFVPSVAKAADEDPDPGVRDIAVYTLTRLADDERVVKALEARLTSPNPTVRGLAAIDLARRGRRPALAHFEAIFTQPDRYGTLPMMRDTISVPMSPEAASRALIPHADAEVLALLVAHAPRFAAHLSPPDWQALGQALRTHAHAAPRLLKTYVTDGWTRNLVERMFKEAGPAMLPALHEALRSPDRVVRSNAARASGSIGDAASIPRLIKALDLESGLARASIVWALGELKATEALPNLAALYVDARNDEERRRGAGFRMAQSQAELAAHYDTIASLESVGGDWDELKAALAAEPVDPRRREELLQPAGVLEAVRKIGPAASQEFYRALAGEKDAGARGEAAVCLAEGAKEDLEKNLPILRNLLTDEAAGVRIRAAVSLFILGEESSRQPILDWLTAGNPWEKAEVLRQLGRVKSPAALSFARRAIEAVAADFTLREEVQRAAQDLLKNIDRPGPGRG